MPLNEDPFFQRHPPDTKRTGAPRTLPPPPYLVTTESTVASLATGFGSGSRPGAASASLLQFAYLAPALGACGPFRGWKVLPLEGPP